MSEDAGGKAENAASTSKKNPSSTSKQDDRPIDNAALAALLRESALYVEQGKFDPILYQALQDFRIYYKQKYPKPGSTSKTHKKKSKKKNSGHSSGSHAASAEAAASKETVVTYNVTPAPDTTDDQKTEEESVQGTHCDDHDHSEAMMMGEAEDTATVTTNTSDDTGEKVFDEMTKSLEPVVDVESAEAELVAEIDAAAAAAAAVEEELPATPVETAVPVEKAVPVSEPIAAASATSYVQSQNINNHNTASSFSNGMAASFNNNNNAATKFHLGQAVFGKLGIPKVANNLKQAAFNATSKKNAQRVRDDLGGIFANGLSQQAESSARRKAPTDDYRNTDGDYYDDWCEVHFTKGCACKSRNYSDGSDLGETTIAAVAAVGQEHDMPSAAAGHQKTDSVAIPSQQQQSDLAVPGTDRTAKSIDSTVGLRGASPVTVQTEKAGAFDAVKAYQGTPSFQRPTNPESALVVHGWIDQHRRSKMRYAWKQVLASLVKATNPKEQTTLWIQREVVNPLTGKKHLEALERIPIRLIQDVTLKEFSPDHQFTIKVLGAADEYVFRCNDAPADAMMWVQTLRKYQWIAKGIIPADVDAAEEKKETSPQQQSTEQPTHTRLNSDQAPALASVLSESSSVSISDLRAICHGAGINTAGMERQQLIHAADEVRKRGTYFEHAGSHASQSSGYVSHPKHAQPGDTQPPPRPPLENAMAPSTASTASVPADEPSSEPQPAPFDEQEAPPPKPTTVQAPEPKQAPQPSERPKLSIKELRSICHGAGVNTMGMERQELEAAAEEVRKRGTYFDPPPGMHAPTEEEARAQQEEQRRQQALRAHQEQLRRQQEHVAALRRLQEEEARKRAAEEQSRRQQEAQTRYQQQQAAWARQQQEEEQRRRQAEQHVAEERRKREEAYRKHQQWSNPSSGQQPQQRSGWNQQPSHHQGHPPTQQQQYPHQQPRHQQQPPQQQRTHPQQQQQQQQQNRNSAASEKYAAMANQTGENGQAIITRIKHDILIQWALQPPKLQMLRPIDTLITTIHKVFPPALGVSGHEYFQKWKPITQSDIVGASGLPEDEKLKKSVRKLRFFLHPDKLPHDLNEEQQFMTKMLWDVTSDAWEEFQKHKEDLDWVKD